MITTYQKLFVWAILLMLGWSIVAAIIYIIVVLIKSIF